MTTEITSISPLGSHPYLTIAEYKQAPTSVDVDDLVGGGSMAINDVELGNVLARASSWVDSHCNQVLAATQDTETFRCRASRDGFLRVHPRYWPIVNVVAASFGSNPNSLVALDPTTCWIEQMAVVFPLVLTNASFLGPIQFSYNYQVLAEQFVSITYVNGYANSVTGAISNNADTTLAVTDLTGFNPGTRFTIFDGANTENVTVATSFVPATGPGSLPLASGLAYGHSSGVSVSALPPAVKQATIYMTNVILKSRGNSAIAMTPLTPQQVIGNNPNVSGDYEAACDLLKPFRRIR